SAADPAALEEVRVGTLGKSGWLTEKLKELGKLAAEQKKEVGARVNRVREEIQSFIEKKKLELEQAEVARKLAKEKIDVTLPGRGAWRTASGNQSQTENRAVVPPGRVQHRDRSRDRRRLPQLRSAEHSREP